MMVDKGLVYIKNSPPEYNFDRENEADLIVTAERITIPVMVLLIREVIRKLHFIGAASRQSRRAQRSATGGGLRV